jgi:hypothetical protein
MSSLNNYSVTKGVLPDEIAELLSDSEMLGNHFHKNVHSIQQFYPELQKKLFVTRQSHRINLTNYNRQYARDMNLISRLPEEQRTLLDFLGCYCSLRFLQFILYYLDRLEQQLIDKSKRMHVFQHFMLDSGWEFRKLTAAYMQNLLRLLKGNKKLPKFVITGVGTRSDQDDIDVGIIDDGTGDRDWLNRVIDRMALEMMRFVTNFHFHLSEHVGTQVYSASIPEYRQLLDHKIGNFVILTEMLGAGYIIGDEPLFGHFKSEVTARYYYKGKINKYHEGYLRGILGEVVDLYSRKIDPDYLHPKFDGLRMIKNIIYAYKTRFGIVEVNPWRIIKVLKNTYPTFRKEFYILENSLSFLEIFRYLYQQLVVQEEYIPIGDGLILENLQRVAQKLLYQDFGPYKAVNQLLYDYQRAVENINEIIPMFIDDLSKHLQRITLFKELNQKSLKGKLTITDFYRDLDFFDPDQYWEDLFHRLGEKPARLNEVLLQNMMGMAILEQSETFRKMIRWEGNHPEFLFKFCATFDSYDNEFHFSMINQLLSFFFQHFKNDFDLITNIISFFRKDPGLFCKVLLIFSPENLQKMKSIIYQKTYKGEIGRYQKNLVELIDLMNFCSHYFKRFIINIYYQFPNYACFIHEPDRIRDECAQILRKLHFIHSVQRKKQSINNYYDLKFLQVGLETFRGKSILEINRDFTSFVSIYFRELYKICLREVVKNSQTAMRLTKYFSIYACGGNGRGQAFDDDFDMIIVVDCEDSSDMNLFREIVSLMNVEMIKRGTLPQFRFSQHFGEYMCPYRGLKELIQSDYPENYIDKSQILGARLLYGNRLFHQRFLSEIVKGIIFRNGEEYIQRMLHEIEDRHRMTPEIQSECTNVKECAGGLRDIDMIVLMYKVLYQLEQTDTYLLIDDFSRLEKQLEDAWKTIRNALIFLQKFRYVYRLTVAADDQISSQGLIRTVLKFNPDLPPEVNPEQWMWEQFSSYRQKCWGAINELMDWIR